MTGRQAHRSVALALSVVMALIGVALVAEALAGGARGLVVRGLLGVLFLAAGLGRLYVEVRRGQGS